MTELLEAAQIAQVVLDDLGLPNCLIGGIAVLRWGEPRLTVDETYRSLLALAVKRKWPKRFCRACGRAYPTRSLLPHATAWYWPKSTR